MIQAGTRPDGVGFVLAGGRSSRMGTEKALLEFGGRPLIAHAVGILAAAGLQASIVGAQVAARPKLEAYAPVVPDSEIGLGPLGGICTALKSTTAKLAVFIPVDIPLLPSSLLEYLLRHALLTESPVTLATLSGFPQTFPAVVSRNALPALDGELRERRLGCLAAFRMASMELGENLSVVSTEILAQSGQVSHPQALPPVRWFLNVNAVQDLRLASSLRSGRVS